MTHEPVQRSVGQINLVVQDVAASVAFYRRIGLSIEEASAPGWTRHHTTAIMANGLRLELDSREFCRAVESRAEAPCRMRRIRHLCHGSFTERRR